MLGSKRGCLPSLRAILVTVPYVVLVLVLVHRIVGPHLWRVRLVAARFFWRFPQQFVPTPARVLPPPDSEFVGVWDQPPAVVRKRLTEDHEFKQLFRAYLHAYERGDRTVYEVASCAYRPDGVTGKWQLHVRLFPAGDGRTDVWAHWELNPTVAPVAHLKREGYDPQRGERALRALLQTDLWDDHDWHPS